MTRFRHGKTSFRWCDRCGTLILGRECEACGAAGREFEVSSPGDLRPCLGKGIKIIKTLFSRHFGTASFLEGRQILLNKIAGEDRADEIIVDGRVMGALRFDMVSNDFILELRGEGAQVLAPLATRGIVRIAQPTGHLKGKSVPGSAIEEVKGEFATGDPLIVLAGRFICSGVAKVPSEKARTAEKAVGIRDVGKSALPLSRRGTGRSDFVDANLSHLLSIESKAVSDIRSYLGNNRLPVTLSFSGGKDSLACYGISHKAVKDLTLIFVDTGLEFPETVEYVHDFARKRGLSLLEARAGNAFWEHVDSFGPPAKDFRWCCKVCKLAPLTSLIETEFPGGTITIEGNRSFESFARSDIGFVESNPFVPNQTILNPIRGWRAIEVWGYIWLRRLEYNPLYDEDFERIGCYLCPSCLASEWRSTEELHPGLGNKWNSHLQRWTEETGGGKEFVRYGFWRWKVLPPKMRKLAEELNLKVPQARADRIDLRMVKGVSPCVTGGYSVEGVVSLPRRRNFSKIAEMMKTLGKVRYSDEYDIALVKAGESTVKVFGGGQVVATGPTPEKSERAFEAGVKAFLRSQLCTACGICAKNCRRKAIRIEDGPVVDGELCDHCGRCSEACVVAHYYDKIVA